MQTASSLFQEYIQFTRVSGTTSQIVLEYQYIEFAQVDGANYKLYISRIHTICTS